MPGTGFKSGRQKAENLTIAGKRDTGINVIFKWLIEVDSVCITPLQGYR